MVSLLSLSQIYNDVYVTTVSVKISLCHIFLLVLEINPACADVNYPNGGSCIHINETNNNVCVCNFEFTGGSCEGIIFTHGDTAYKSN